MSIVLSASIFYITWEKNFPRGCKALGFKSIEMPFNVVSQSSGMRCLYFEQKDSPLDEKKTVDITIYSLNVQEGTYRC